MLKTLHEMTIPEGWAVNKLSDVSRIIMGQSPDSISYNEQAIGYPFLQGCAEFGRKYPVPVICCSSPTKISPKDSILISVRAPVGDTNLSNTSYCIGRGLAAIVPESINIYYLYEYIKLNRDKLERVSQGSTFAAIGSKELINFNVLTPPLPEQKAIASVLTTIDNVIEKTEALIEKLKNMKKGLMQDLFTRGVLPDGNLRPPKDEAPELYKESELGWIPKEWEVVRLGEFEFSSIEVIDGDRGENYPKEDELLEEGYCLFLSAKNVTRTGFKFNECQFIDQDKDNILGTGKLKRNDIVITTRGTVGNIAYYNNNISFDNIRINSGMIILRSNSSIANNEYLYLNLTEYQFENEYKRVISGSAQPQLPMKDMKKFRLIYPPITEQQRMIDFCKTINLKIARLENDVCKKSSIKKGLMDDLLTGRVRTTELIEEDTII